MLKKVRDAVLGSALALIFLALVAMFLFVLIRNTNPPKPVFKYEEDEMVRCYFYADQMQCFEK